MEMQELYHTRENRRDYSIPRTQKEILEGYNARNRTCPDPTYLKKDKYSCNK
jgi:hypothetical protein